MTKSDSSISSVVTLVIKKFSDRDFFKLSTIIECYKFQGYGHITTNCPSPIKITITDGVLIEAPKPNGTISLKVTLVIKELCVFSSAPTTIFLAVTIVTRPFFSCCTANTTFSASFAADPCYRYLLWSPTPSSLAADMIPFSFMVYVRY